MEGRLDVSLRIDRQKPGAGRVIAGGGPGAARTIAANGSPAAWPAQLTVRCVCRWETTGPADAVVDAATDHGLRVHNMRATREQILATAVEADGGDAVMAGAASADAGSAGP